MKKLVIAGDSTAADYAGASYPMTGWGQMLPVLMPAYRVVNLAQCGRSSKSFLDEGWLDAAGRELEPGGLFLIQFGHNDEKEDEARRTEPFTTYQAYLSRYLARAKERGAQPILLSPAARRSFDDAGNPLNTHGDYPAAMEQLARREAVPFIHMTGLTEDLYRALGPEGSKALFTRVKPGEYPGYPEGHGDNTHFCREGALRIAEIVAENLRRLGY